MSTADFVELWAEGENSFQEDPPNAVLAFLEPGDDTPEDAVVVIREPRLENGRLSYSIDALEGTGSGPGGACDAFIDRSVGRSPRCRCVACAGVSGGRF